MGLFGRNSGSDDKAKVEAIMRSQAVIEFGLDGTIITANANFLNALGYSLEEVVGQHHRLFVDPAEAQSPAYQQFWADLAAGKFQAAAYRRLSPPIAALARAGARCGFRPVTIRCSTRPASRSR